MDKYEYKLKLDQMKTLMAGNNYSEAAEIADTVNWNKIKNVNALIKAGEIYEKVGRYEESKNILLMAYDRSPIGRMIVYHLAEIAIKLGNYDEAKEYYDEFVEIAPHDNLKYVLRYEICKAEDDTDYVTLIEVLEELKEQEYSEEWAYELAYLYHRAGMSEKCIEACDELILWFGDGPYVERALELKMLYQPLTHQQEEKYRLFCQKKEGVVEVTPEEEFESGEIVNETIQIQDVKLSAERFNTQNLQEELQKSMQQIMEATEKEEVADSMDNIKKLVEEIPYLQIPKEELLKAPTAKLPHIETDAEIDNSIKTNFKELLAEDRDGQMSLYVPERYAIEAQITGQINIEEVLAEWEKTKRAAEAVLQEAQQRKLQSAKARALQEAGDIMQRLADVIPKLDSGLTPKDLLDEQYLGELGETSIEDDKAAEMVANMNQILQQEIDRLSTENAQMDEQLAAVEAERLTEVELTAEPETSDEIEYADELEMPGEIELTAEPEMSDEIEYADELEMPQETEAADEDVAELLAAGVQELLAEEGISDEPETAWEKKLETDIATVEEKLAMQAAAVLEEPQMPENSIVSEASKTADKIDAVDVEHVLLAEMEKELHPVKKLSEEQRELFTYFLPIKGMEEQICQALTGVSDRISSGRAASTGNMIVQGGRGSGKTVLATSVIKALREEIGKPEGRIGKIEASMLNQKDVESVFRKVAGGCLIIEKAGGISRETAQKMAALLEKDTSGIFVIIEDTRRGIEKALSRDINFAARFSEKIQIPIFTSDELVAFAKSYAKELGYTIDEMGVLAVYNSISNIQKLDQATTLTEVKEIIDQAIARAERGGLKKAFSIIASRRYDEDDYIILREKDFGF